MTGTHTPATSPRRSWARVVALLTEATDRGYRDAVSDPAVHAIAVAAHGLAAAAFTLLPVPQRTHLEDLMLPPESTTSGMVELIREAAASIARLPIDQVPAGAGGVATGIHALIAELDA